VLQQKKRQMKSFLDLVEEKATGQVSSTHGLFKAIFVTGCPGSGKDVIVRESISEPNAIEINLVQAFVFLADKKALSEHSDDYRREAIRNRGPLIINGPADDFSRIAYVKEELEDLGYSTLMIFVNATDDVSQERNMRLSRRLDESVRFDKWAIAQKNLTIFKQIFEGFVEFDNSDSIDESQESLDYISKLTETFFDKKVLNDISESWLKSNGKLNRFLKETKTAKSIQTSTTRKYNPFFKAAGPADAIPDNDRGRNPLGQGDQIKGGTFPRKDPNGQTAGGAWSGAYNESAPTLKISAPPKEPKFRMDNDKLKRMKRGNTSLSAARIGKPSGVGPEYDTRAGGQGAAAGAGLGDQTYREEFSPTASNADVANFAGQPRGVVVNPLDNRYTGKDFNKFRKSIKKESIDDPGSGDMGVGGTLGGASNKEGMDSYKDPLRNIKNDYGIKIKRKKGRK
jgi:hypothetical protein